MKREIVTGANGQLGHIQAAAKDFTLDLVFLDKNTLDINDSEAIKGVFASQSFGICINTAAYTDVMVRSPTKRSPMRLIPRPLKPLPSPVKNMSAGLYIFQPTMSLMAL